MERHDRTVQRTVRIYVQAWNEPDLDKRRSLLDSCWADRATYLDPVAKYEGREELASGCRSFDSRWPGAAVQIVGDVVSHHGWACFAWRVTGRGGETLREGVDFAELDQDRLIRRVIGFFGMPPWTGTPSSADDVPNCAG